MANRNVISDLDKVVVPSRERTKYKLPKEIFDLFDWRTNSGKWVRVRLFGEVGVTANYWVQVTKKDNTQTAFPVPCLSFDPATGMRDPQKKDPWGDFERNAAQYVGENAKPPVTYTVSYYINAIFRQEQELEPGKIRITESEKRTGFKSKDSNSWTPVKVIRLPPSVLAKIQSLKPLNSVKFKSGAIKCFHVLDEKFGRDLLIKYDSNQSPSQMYEIQMGDGRTPLSEAEKAYLKYDFKELQQEINAEEVIRDYEQWFKRSGFGVASVMQAGSKAIVDEIDDGDDIDYEKPVSKKKVVKAASKSHSKKEELDDEDLEQVDNEDDELEDTPFEDEEEENDFDDSDSDFEDDEEEFEELEEKPKKKSVKKVVKAKKKVDEDFDDDEDFDF